MKRVCQMAGAYFDLENGAGFGDQIQIKSNRKEKQNKKQV